jgi:hypothetical protein
MFEKFHAGARRFSISRVALNVALKAAEVADSEREELRLRILGPKESLDETRLALKLIIRHATANTRPYPAAAFRARKVSSAFSQSSSGEPSGQPRSCQYS